MNAVASRSAQGFTLIEIALALMVASMGLLVVMGLFVDGLVTQQVTVDETQAALFAEEVIQSVRALAAENWNTLSSLQLPPAAGDLWESGNPARVVADGNIHTNRYVVRNSGGIQDFAVRYRLDIDNGSSPNLKEVRLEVWNGEFGDKHKSRVYYTELFNTRFK
jgi:prepilin-type N-terminal cleavage/methylation domain-containing protein